MSLQNFRSRFYRTTHYYHPQLIFLGQNGTSFKGQKKLEIRDFDPFSTTSSKYGTSTSTLPSHSPSSTIHTKWYYMCATTFIFCVQLISHS
ncbi:hypothetical protein PFMALIP_00633 [Plasmodium falciparum MaliPS096_E11]|uniref:Uncharacterized protein n=1 Tax=Plasmodium falciparum MaliPS096_E11 TaxID=1036727 RepID=A0A024WVP0_PLAFA|nr:hypothetical protein PFMALIP_00633 [Plasmodium falciparum MaliPS096_E11]